MIAITASGGAGRFLSLCIVFLCLAFASRAADFQVTNGNDAGSGSLRQAILDANAAGTGPHTITFSGVSGVINLASPLPAITVPGVTVDGAGVITVSANVGNVDRDIFTVSADNVTLRGMTLQNTGTEAIQVNGARTGLTFEDLTIRHTGGDFINNGIYVGGISTNMTIRNVVMTDIENAAFGIRFANVANNVLIDNFSMSGGAGNAARGITFANNVNGVTVKNSTIDLNSPATNDDGDYGIFFNAAATAVTIDSCVFHDNEIYAVYFAGVANNIQIKHSSFDNFNGWTGTQMIRFQGNANTVLIDSVQMNLDQNGTVNDGDYGIYFAGNMQNVTIRNSTFIEADVNGIAAAAINNDNVLITGNLFERNGSGNSVDGAIQFFGVRSATSDGGPVEFSNNTFRDNNGAAIFLRPNDAGSYVIPNLTVKNNTITGTKSNIGGIRINYIDKIIISQNSVYNNVGRGIELADGSNANCGYEGANGVHMLSSAETSPGSGMYNIRVKLPAACGTNGCSLELFSNEAGIKGVGGQHYIQTFTGLGQGEQTLTGVTGSFPEITSAPYGTWSATMRVTANNCGTSEYSNRIAIKVNGPAGVDNGVQLWLNPDFTDAGNMVNGIGWEDFSGNNRHFNIVSGDPARVTAGLNYNHYINFDGNDYLRSNVSPFVKNYPAGEVISVGKTPVTNTQNGNMYDFGGNSRNFHYTWTNGAVYNGFGTNDRFAWNPLTKAIVDAKAGINAASIIGEPIDVKKWNIYGTHAAPANWGVDFNGGQQTVSTSTNTVNFGLLTGNEHVGATSGFPFNGDIAEQILYNRVLTPQERQRVNSYLAVKYGLTLFQNYVASDGTTTWWNRTTNNGFNKGIAGLAKDVLSVLHQKQSRSVSASDVVTIGVGSVLYGANEDNDAHIKNDRSAFMWGTDSAIVAYNTPFVTAYASARLARRWKVQKTNWADTTIIIKLQGGNANRTLLVSADPSFPTGSTEHYALNDTGAVILNSSALPDGVYFTFANQLAGPGCVTLGVQAWFRADDANATSSLWTDYSGFDRGAAQPNAAYQPVYTSSGINFNPAFNFDGANDYMDIPHNLGINGTQAFTVLSVTKRESVGTVDLILGQQSSATNTFSYFLNGAGKTAVGPVNVSNITTTGSPATANTPYLSAITRSGNLFNLYSNGAADGSGTQPYTFLNINQRIGWRGGSTVDWFDGNISEIIVYNRALNAAELLQVNSYLALKYGITLNNGTTNYVASDGATTMWNAADNTGFNKDIAGLGKDTCGNLHQKQSRSVNTGSLVTFALGDGVAESNLSNTSTVTNNLSFLTWGNDGGATTYTNAISGTNVTVRMGRIWKVDKTNWADQNITIKLNGSARNTYLLISNADAGFATIDQELALNDDSTVTINSSLLPDGAYFTFGKQILGPGYVNNGVNMWLRGDDGVSASNSWFDYSGNSIDAVQNTVANQPVLVNNLNFNPAFDFDGTNDFMTAPLNINPGVADPITVFTVYNAEAVSANNRALWGNDNGGFDRYMELARVGGNNASVSFTGGNEVGRAFINATIMDDGPANGSSVFINNARVLNFTQANSAGGTATTNIGNWGNGGYFSGKIAEVVFYNRALDSTERLKVNSYLALKYGITLNGGTVDYLATDWDGTTGTKSWTASKNTGFGFRIAGLGRDDRTNLYQKQSRSQEANALITIAAGTEIAADNTANASSIDDLSFFTWSDNNLGTSFSEAVTSVTNATGRMARVWKIDRTNWADQEITIQTDKIGVRYLLVHATDPTFGAGTNEFEFDAANGTITISTAELPDGAYFTLATKIVGPGCVNNGVQAWLKADYAYNGSNWIDFSGQQQIFTQPTAASQPTFKKTGLNFNASLAFDGNDWLNIPQMYEGTDDITAFFVSRTNTLNDVNWTNMAEFGDDQPGFYWKGGRPTLWVDNVTTQNMPHTKTYNTSTHAMFAFVLPNRNPKNFQIIADGEAETFTGADGTYTVNGGAAGRRLGGVVTDASQVNFNGEMAEVIFYKGILSEADMTRVQSYLALKYGITLNNGTVDYVASDGSTRMWTAADNIGYQSRITGIGRDDCDELHQKQSRSQFGGLVTIAIGSEVAASNADNTDSIAANNSYFVFADNNLDTTWSVPVTVPGLQATVHMPRIWKVDKTNWTDATITLKYNGNASGVSLLISTDATFATGVQELTISADSVVNLSTELLPDGAYFTFGKEVHGPGYVNNGVRLWLRADANITETGPGSVVTQWEDFSGNGVIFEKNGANPLPLFETTNPQFNFNPSLDFVPAGAEQMIALNAGSLIDASTPDNYSMFMAIVKDVAANQRPFTHLNTNSNAYLMDINFAGRAGLTFEYEDGVSIPFNETKLLGITYDGTPANRRGYHDGKVTVDATTTTSVVNDALPGTAELGAGNSNGNFGGHMAELIVYNRQVADFEAQRIQSYLALKYGVTLDQTTPNNYVASNWNGTTGTIYWDATANAGYNNNIAGIGRDDSTSLLQKQSRSVNPGDANMVAIGFTELAATNTENSGIFDDDLSFMVWGDNGLFGLQITEYPSELDVNGCSRVTRLQREWKIQETGNVGFVQMQLYLAGQVPNSTTISDLKLLIDDDGDFGNGGTTVVEPFAYDAATQTATFNNLNFTDGQYFTLVTDVTNEAPGGITNNLYTWLRADKGVLTATGVREWLDQSPMGLSVEQSTAGAQPVYNSTTNLMNFNPTISFDGTNDVLSNAAWNHNASTNGEDVFAVILPTGGDYIGFGRATAGTDMFTRFYMGSASGRLGYLSRVGTSNPFIESSGTSNGTVQIANMHRDATGNATIDMNGTTVVSGLVNMFPNINYLNIGARRANTTTSVGNDQWYNGQVAEVVVYNGQVTPADRIKIASYLGIKYGITLPHDYVYPDGTIVWDQAANASFSNNITGIGRDDCNGLHQKQSKSVNAGALVTIATGSVVEVSNAANLNMLENNSALLFGDDNGAIDTWTSTESPSGRSRIAREWKLQLTGTIGTVTIQVPASSSTATTKLPAELNKMYMLVDDDGDFSSGAMELPMTLNGDNWELNYEFTGNTYFTFATGTDFLVLNAKANLQGAWNGTTMRTDLKTAGVLPTTDPYGLNTTPSVDPNATAAAVVDWVKVELRDATDPAIVVASRAAFVLANGNIVDTSYTQPLAFFGVDPAAYHVVVRHRNHLGVMSLNTIDMSSGSGAIDFTNNTTDTWGAAAQKDLGGGVMGLWAGNVNGDSSVRHSAKPSDVSDVANAVLTHAGNASADPAYTGFINAYSPFDVNLDGRVYYTASPSDRAIIVDNIVTHPANTFGLASYIIVEQIP